METIFKSALRRVRADEKLKEHTRSYLEKALQPEAVRTRRAAAFRRRAVAAVCSMALLAGVSAGAYAAYRTPTAYLSLDINPSVELGVNFLGRVVSATAYNSDGETILQGHNVRGAAIREAVRRLVQSAAQNGFVAPDGSTVIAVTSETDQPGTAARLQEAAALGAGEGVESQGDTASVQKENVALERRDEARRLGITPGKLNLIQKLQALDSSITVDEYKDAKVTEIMNKYVELKRASLGKDTKPEDPEASSGSGESSQAAASDGKTGSAVSSANPGGNGNGNGYGKSKAGKQNGSTGGSETASAVSDTAGGVSGRGNGAVSNGSAGNRAAYGRSTAASHK